MTKKKRPTAESENATGYPSSRNTTRDANMIGAMLCAMISAILGTPMMHWRNERRTALLLPGSLLGFFLHRLENTLRLCLRGSVMAAPRHRVLQVALDDGDALDQLRDALHEEQREGQGDQELGGVDGQATGIRRLLVLQQRAHEERPAQHRHHGRHGKQEEDMAEDVDPVAC